MTMGPWGWLGDAGNANAYSVSLIPMIRYIPMPHLYPWTSFYHSSYFSIFLSSMSLRLLLSANALIIYSSSLCWLPRDFVLYISVISASI